MCFTHHGFLPGFSAQGIDEVVLSSCSRPYCSQLPETRGEREIAQDAEDKTVEKRDGAP